MPGGCKQWWSIARQLMQRKGVCSSVSALRNSTKQWVLDAKCKADLFVETFSRKHVLPEAEMNDYTEIGAMPFRAQKTVAEFTEADVEVRLTDYVWTAARGLTIYQRVF
jgi:hypothetical protein